jgi:hypothetical protein
LYLFISLVLWSGYHATRAAPFLHLQASPGNESTGSSPSSITEEKSSAISETTRAGLDAPFNAHRHSRFVNGQPLVPNPRSLVIPKIVVQDFSTEDGLVRYKTPEYDPTHNLKRRRRPSWARVSTTLGDHLAVTARPSFRLPPTPGVRAVGGLRPLYLVDGLKHRRSDVPVQSLLGISGRKRVPGDIVAKDGSFVVVGL